MDQWTSGTVRVALQVLESMYLIETSKRLEVVKGRFDFITQVVEPGLPPLLVELTVAEKTSGYSNAIEKAIGHYQQLYPDRPPSSEALSLLNSPGAIDTTTIYTSNLLRILELTFKQAQEDLTRLKRSDVIEKRKAKFSQELRAVYMELNGRCHGVSTAKKAMEMIEGILTQLTKPGL